MGVLNNFRETQKQLLPDDDAVFEESIPGYKVRAEFVSGLVRSISDKAVSLGKHHYQSSGRHSSYEDSVERNHYEEGRVTSLSLEKIDGSVETRYMHSYQNEDLLKGITTGEAVTVCLASATEAQDEERPEVVMAYRHTDKDERKLPMGNKPVSLASGRLLSMLYKYAVKRAVTLFLIVLALYGSTFLIWQHRNPAEPLFNEYLQLIGPAYSLTMELLVLSGACSWKVCTPGYTPETVGGWLWTFGVFVVLGAMAGIWKSFKLRKRVQLKNRAFNKMIDWIHSESRERVKTYGLREVKSSVVSSPENCADDTSHDSNHDSAARVISSGGYENQSPDEKILPAKSYGFEKPPGERRFKFQIKRKTFYFKDITDRIESFKREVLHSTSQKKGQIRYASGKVDEFTHRSEISTDVAEHVRIMSGLCENGKIETVVVPEAFSVGPVKPDDLLTVFEVDFQGSFKRPKTYGAMALINHSQGWEQVPENLQGVADILMEVKRDFALWLLAPFGAISFLILILGFALGGMPGELLITALAGLASFFIAYSFIERRRKRRRIRFAEFLKTQLRNRLEASLKSDEGD